jgi:hypothetical protein
MFHEEAFFLDALPFSLDVVRLVLGYHTRDVIEQLKARTYSVRTLLDRDWQPPGPYAFRSMTSMNRDKSFPIRFWWLVPAETRVDFVMSVDPYLVNRWDIPIDVRLHIRKLRGTFKDELCFTIKATAMAILAIAFFWILKWSLT